MVIIRSCVSMLSLIRIGIPCSGPRGPRLFAFAIESGGDPLRVRIHFDDRVECRTFLIDVGDPIGVFLDELFRSVFAGLKALLEIRDGQFVEFERRWMRRRGFGAVLRWLTQTTGLAIVTTQRGGCLQKVSTFHAGNVTDAR